MTVSVPPVTFRNVSRAPFSSRAILEYVRAELRAPRRLVHEPAQRVQKRVHARLPQRGAEQAREHPPVRDERRDLRVGKRAEARYASISASSDRESSS